MLGKANMETILSSEKIEKLKKLLGSLNTLQHNFDMYSQCIKEVLTKEIHIMKK